MSRHEVEYDEQGLSKTDPWTLDEYLTADRFTAAEKAVIEESVLSWLREYDQAGCDITEPLRELGPDL